MPGVPLVNNSAVIATGGGARSKVPQVKQPVVAAPPRPPDFTQPPPRPPVLTQPPPRAPVSTQSQFSNVPRHIPPRFLAQQQVYAQATAAAPAAAQNSQPRVAHQPPTDARPKSPANPYEEYVFFNSKKILFPRCQDSSGLKKN